MRTPMARPGRRSPGRALAAPAVSYRRLAARGGQPVALAQVTGAAPDIIELILADHEPIRRLLRKDDDAAGYGEDPGCPGAQPWMVPMRRWQVCTLSRSTWECARCSRFRCRSIRVGVRLAHRDAPGPMDGEVLADLLVLTHAPDGSAARTRRCRIRAAVDVRSAGRLPGSSSPGTELITDQLGVAQPDALMRTRAYALGHRRAAADVAAAALARLIRFRRADHRARAQILRELRTAHDREARQCIGSSVSRRPSCSWRTP
jgi:hypothetical protein